tara:strand:+ start:313 stop:519 length:207 start_codon:yes stop_codon:yes gene_type:complete
MLTKFMLNLLPKRYSALVDMGLRMVANLDTAEERDLAVAKFTAIMKDGKVTPPEWSSLGKALKIWGSK